MTREDRLEEYRHAIGRAEEHRTNAEHLQANLGQEQDPEKQESLHTQVREETEKAEEYEKYAQEILEQGDPEQALEQDSQEQAFSVDDVEHEQGDQDEQSQAGRARAWYEPGSVADDVLLQVNEANQGSMITNVLEYAARSVFDEEHREFEGAKMLKSLATAPVTAYQGAASAARSFQSQSRTPALEAKDPARSDDRLDLTGQTSNSRDTAQAQTRAQVQDRAREQEHEIGER